MYSFLLTNEFMVIISNNETWYSSLFKIRIKYVYPINIFLVYVVCESDLIKHGLYVRTFMLIDMPMKCLDPYVLRGCRALEYSLMLCVWTLMC